MSPGSLGERAYEHLEQIDAVRRFRRIFATVLSVVALLAGILSALVLFFTKPAGVDVLGTQEVTRLRANMDDRIIRIIRTQQADIQDLRRFQRDMARLAPSERVASRIAAIEARLDELSAQNTRIEKVILESPEKSLSIPMMRRDIDHAREANLQAAATTKASIDQIYDLTKWLLGALTVGVLSLAGTTFFRTRAE